MAEFPKQRVDDLVVTRTQGDMLVYDERSKGLHTLNAEMATVWEACDGNRSVSQIAVLTGLDQSLVDHALGKLSHADLLVRSLPSSGESQSRRRLLKKAAVGVGVAVPTIISITAPAAASIPSCDPYPGFLDHCTGNGQIAATAEPHMQECDEGGWYCLGLATILEAIAA